MMKDVYDRKLSLRQVFRNAILAKELLDIVPSVTANLQQKTDLQWQRRGNAMIATAAGWNFVVKAGSLSIDSPTVSHICTCTDEDIVARITAFLRDPTPRFKRMLREPVIPLGDLDLPEPESAE